VVSILRGLGVKVIPLKLHHKPLTSQFARLNPVQEQMLKVLGLPRPVKAGEKLFKKFSDLGYVRLLEKLA